MSDIIEDIVEGIVEEVNPGDSGSMDGGYQDSWQEIAVNRVNQFARYVKFIVESTGKEYNSKTDWLLYMQNWNCIGDPNQQTTYIQVPGSDRQIDASEALTGRPTYYQRPITIELAGKFNKNTWDSIISAIRNSIEGQLCRIIFSNDSSYFWRGRVHLVEFTQECGIGHLTLSIPEADPYKYSLRQSVDRWEWNSFSFLTGVITNADYISVNGTRVVEIPKGYMEVVPVFDVKTGSANLKVSNGKITKALKDGNNRDPRIRVNGSEKVTLTFTGYGQVGVVYRGGCL